MYGVLRNVIQWARGSFQVAIESAETVSGGSIGECDVG